MLSPFPVHLRDSSKPAPDAVPRRPRLHTFSGPPPRSLPTSPDKIHTASTDAGVGRGRGKPISFLYRGRRAAANHDNPEQRNMHASGTVGAHSGLVGPPTGFAPSTSHPPSSFHLRTRPRSASASSSSRPTPRPSPDVVRPHTGHGVQQSPVRGPYSPSIQASLLPWSTHSPASTSKHASSSRPSTSQGLAHYEPTPAAQPSATSLQGPSISSTSTDSHPSSSQSDPLANPSGPMSKFNTTDCTILRSLQASLDARAAQFAHRGPLDTPLWGQGVGAASHQHPPSNAIPVPVKKHRPSVPSYSPVSQRSGISALSEGEVTDREDGGMKLSSINPLPPTSTVGTSLNVHGGLDRSKRLHHPFSSQEVPYPRNYAREILDLDAWDTLWLRRACKSVTFHAFPNGESTTTKHPPPTRVLDIGCGSGSWILECASVWKECHFVGLDIVPLHPDLAHVFPNLAKRVTWVQANFLEGLPFPSEEFDFVHIKRIARGVPEDKWDDLFEEINRVMKPGAALEIIEEDLVFPGRTPDMDVQSENGSVRGFSMQSRTDSRRDRTGTTDEHYGHSAPRADSIGSTDSVPTLSHSSDSSSGTSTVPDVSLYADKSVGEDGDSVKTLDASRVVRSRSLNLSSHVRIQGIISPSAETVKPVSSSHEPASLPDGIIPSGRRKSWKNRPSTASAVSPPHSMSSPSAGVHRLSGPPKAKSNAAAQAVLMETAMPQYIMFPYAGARMAAAGYGPPPGKAGLGAGAGSKSRVSLDVSGGVKGRQSVGVGADGVVFPSVEGGLSVSSRSLPSDGVVAPAGKSLRSTVGSEATAGGGDYGTLPDPRDHTVLETIYNEMHAERFVNLSPLSLLANTLGVWFKDVRTHPPIVFKLPPAGPMEGRIVLSMQDLLTGTSPYVALDDARLCAFSPTRKTSDVGDLGHDEYTGATGRWLPNETLEIDLRTLNVHLMLRVKEVLGCAEAMWEWVAEYQRRGRSGDGVFGAISSLSRAEFDALLVRFDLDMGEHMALGSALQDRLGWTPMSPGPAPEQKQLFDATCEAYIRNAPARRAWPPPPLSRLSRSMRVFVAWKAAA